MVEFVNALASFFKKSSNDGRLLPVVQDYENVINSLASTSIEQIPSFFLLFFIERN